LKRVGTHLSKNQFRSGKVEKQNINKQNSKLMSSPYQVAVVKDVAPTPVAADPRVTMRGLQPGGLYQSEKYCGVVTILIGVCLFPCVCCCPCDSREVYIEPGTGRRAVLN